jgi:hypothetical protein
MNYRPQKGSCCQLIAAINARIYLGLDDVPEEEFERLIDKARCRHGSALAVETVYGELSLAHEDGPLELEWIATHLPVQLTIFDPQLGFHATLVTGVRQPALLQLQNASFDEIYWSELEKILPPPQVRRCRSFGLLPKACC